MSVQKPELKEIFAKLDSQVKATQFKKALNTVEQLLQQDNLNEAALHTKGVLLVQSGMHEELLSFLGKPSGKRIAGKLAFEKAYCLYRLNNFEEALEALDEVGEDRITGKLHLRAQILLRLGRSKEAIAVYNDLYSKQKDKSFELCTNVLAAYVESERSAEVPQVMEAMKISEKDSYEVGFNKACALIATGKIMEAEEQLLVTQRIGQETLYSEDFTDLEVEEEMAPVKGQLAFIASHCGRSAEAVQMTEETIKAARNDFGTKAVAEINLASSRVLDPSRKSNLGDSLRRLEAMMAHPGNPSCLELKQELQARLTTGQQQTLHYNRAVILLRMGRMSAFRELVGALASAYPDNAGVLQLRARLLGSEGHQKEASSILAKAQDALEGNALRETLLLRCKMLSSEDPVQAAHVLNTGGEEFLHSPAVIGAKLDLLRRAKNRKELESTLHSAVSRWESMTENGGERAAALGFLLEAQAQAHMEEGRMREAAGCLRRALGEHRSSDMSLLSRLIRMTALFDLEAASEIGQHLTPIETTEEADIESQLNEILAKPHKRFGDQKGEGVKPKKRKRKVIYPKGFDPENPGLPPNPERWLPKTQRSDYKKKKRGQHLRAQQSSVKGSQGSGKVDESLDKSSAAGNGTSGSAASERARNTKKGKKARR